MNRRKWVRGKNRRAESNIVTAYLQNIEVSYSHLYQEMQQAVYDSETFARVDSDSDIYTYNRSIMAVKEYFQQLGISYGQPGTAASDVSNAVRKTLADLHERGYKIALGSSSRKAKIILKKVALEEAFDAISDGTNISKSKPDPEVFLKAAEYLDLQPEECIVVEDAYAGIDAAKAGNMQAVGTGEAYSYAKADYHIKKIEELLTILP